MTGRFRRAVARLTADDQELASQQLQGELEQAGATAVTRCTRGEPVCVAGSLRSVTLRPRAGVPTLEAELYDGTGSITLIWLGRRRIGGIECGRSLIARGRMTEHEGRPTIYNASYELKPSLG
ncbi:MAG: DNA-binding protein [Frankiales bacterium]|nr:DNA-binding protein [Frankiales bacterium]